MNSAFGVFSNLVYVDGVLVPVIDVLVLHYNNDTEQSPVPSGARQKAEVFDGKNRNYR